jgi:predicted transcriptional regulator
MYVDILKALAHEGPLELTDVMCKSNVNFNVLKEYLDFLVKQGLVEERTKTEQRTVYAVILGEERTITKQRTVYAVTQRGITLLTYLNEQEYVPLPIVEETRNGMPIPY